MRWKIRKEEKLLQLWQNDNMFEGSYYIEFDRLTESDWFLHLSEKSWINMDKLFWAFYRAYEAAGIPIEEDFFRRFKEAYRNYANIRFYNLIYSIGKKDIIPRKVNSPNVADVIDEEKIIKSAIDKSF